MFVFFFQSQHTVKISETKLGRDSLIVDVDIQCGCNCDYSEEMMQLQSACPQNSRLICGICQCDKGW